jgi:hypothetical protein
MLTVPGFRGTLARHYFREIQELSTAVRLEN